MAEQRGGPSGAGGRITGAFLCAVMVGAVGLGAAHTSPPPLPAASPAPTYATVLLDRPVTTSPTSPPPRAVPAAPRLPHGSGSERRVVYSLSAQRVWVVESGRTVLRSYLVSGQDWQPGPGSYHVYSRSRRTVSELGGALLRYMIRFAYGRERGLPIGFHAIPLTPEGRPEQSVEQLGQPLSAGCVRQKLSDARYLWRFAPVGTTVVVTA